MTFADQHLRIPMTADEAVRILNHSDDGLLDEQDPAIARIVREARFVSGRRRGPREPLTRGPRLERHITIVTCVTIGLAVCAVAVPAVLSLHG